MLVTASTVWAAQTEPPEITVQFDEDAQEVTITATGYGTVILYYDDIEVARGEGAVSCVVPFTEDPEGEEMGFSATAQEEGKLVSDYAFATVYIPGKTDEPVQITPEPEIIYEVREDDVIITAVGEGDVRLYVNGELVENPCVIMRGEVDEYVYVQATAQVEGMDISSYRVMEIIIPAWEDGPDPNDPHMSGYWLVLLDKYGDEVWKELAETWYYDYEKDTYVIIYHLYDLWIDYQTYSVINYYTETAPYKDVPCYFMINGVRYGPETPDLDITSGVYQSESGGWSYVLPFTPTADDYFHFPAGYSCDWLRIYDGKVSVGFNISTGTGWGSLTTVAVIDKDGNVTEFPLRKDVALPSEQYGSDEYDGGVPFYFNHYWTEWTFRYYNGSSGAETDGMNAILEVPFAQKTMRVNRVTDVKKFVVQPDGVYQFGIFENYLYAKQTGSCVSCTGENTSFTVNKSNIPIGEYLTFRAQYDFLEEYVNRISDVQLVVELPESCTFFDNSVMVNNEIASYTVNANTITIPLNNYSGIVHFCAIPNAVGGQVAQCYLHYNLDGELNKQFVDRAQFYAFDLSLMAPPLTSTPTITVHGKAAGGQLVKVYDGGVQIAQTTCLENGSWRVTCNLNQPVNTSLHNIKAVVKLSDGTEYSTEPKEVWYREVETQPDRITMYYNGGAYVFDFVNGTTTPWYYNYVPGESQFTFVAKFNGNTTSVSNLNLKVLDTSGEVITYNGVFCTSQSVYLCSASYSYTEKLPTSVGVEFDYVSNGELCHYENVFIDNTNGVTPNIIPCIDPSGYVYEGVPSNRLQGVTTTCYYKEPETGEAVLWDAEQYEQQNPLLTDENGYYRWDVPVGMWQVKYEKEGYETTYSDWLPVPPPQLDVNIGMVQMSEPIVIKAHAYPQAVELEFDKYMYPETLTTGNITVSVNGKAVDGSIELLNAEVDDPDAITSLRRSKGTGLTFASRVRFNADQPFDADKVTLHVKKDVTSYAGVQMASDYEAVLPLEMEMQQIVVDSVAVVPFMGDRQLNVAVQPGAAAAGKTLLVRSVAPMIATTAAESYTLDNNGQAVVTVHGDLPGASMLLYSIEGYHLTASTLIEVSMDAEATVAIPTASIASGSEVEKGTEVYLFCTTPGATIYYTLDGSCPCDPSDTRKVYDGTPIIINDDVTIQAMATAPDMLDSEVATFIYHVASSGLRGDVNGDGEVNIADVNALIDVILSGRTDDMTADVNGDGEVNIADINALIDIILNPGNHTMLKVNSDALLHLNDLSMKPGEVRTLNVTVDNASRYSAMQCDIVLPDGLTLLDVNAASGNEGISAVLDDHSSRAVSYSPAKRPFASAAQPVLTLTVHADGDLAACSEITLTNVVLADAGNKAWRLADATARVNNSSGVNDLTAGNDRVWVEGRTLCIASQHDGIARIAAVSGIVRDLTVTHGVTRQVLEPGIYVIVLNGKSHKIAVK